MNSVFRIATKALLFFRLISIDIVLGAVSGSYFASVISNIKLSVYFYFTLASVVWIIYVRVYCALLSGKRIDHFWHLHIYPCCNLPFF